MNEHYNVLHVEPIDDAQLGAGAELWAGLDGPGPAHIDSWPAQSEIKK